MRVLYKSSDIELINVKDEFPKVVKKGIAKTTWRFLVVDDESVGYFISRDCDSRLTNRDAALVRHFIMKANRVSPKAFMTARDNFHHNKAHPILAGMWGGYGPGFRELLEGKSFQSLLLHSTDAADSSRRCADQDFLKNVIWPRVKQYESDTCYDSFKCENKNLRPFPLDHVGLDHVGQVVIMPEERVEVRDEFQETRQKSCSDTRPLFESLECPPADPSILAIDQPNKVAMRSSRAWILKANADDVDINAVLSTQRPGCIENTLTVVAMLPCSFISQGTAFSDSEEVRLTVFPSNTSTAEKVDNGDVPTFDELATVQAPIAQSTEDFVFEHLVQLLLLHNVVPSRVPVSVYIPKSMEPIVDFFVGMLSLDTSRIIRRDETVHTEYAKVVYAVSSVPGYCPALGQRVSALRALRDALRTSINAPQFDVSTDMELPGYVLVMGNKLQLQARKALLDLITTHFLRVETIDTDVPDKKQDNQVNTGLKIAHASVILSLNADAIEPKLYNLIFCRPGTRVRVSGATRHIWNSLQRMGQALDLDIDVLEPNAQDDKIIHSLLAAPWYF